MKRVISLLLNNTPIQINVLENECIVYIKEDEYLYETTNIEDILKELKDSIV